MIKIPGVQNIKIQITGKGGTGLGGGKDGTGLGGGKDGTGLGGGKDGTGLGGGKDGTGLGGGKDGTGLGGGTLIFGGLEFGGKDGDGLTFNELDFWGKGGEGLGGGGLEFDGKGGTGLGGGKDGTGLGGGKDGTGLGGGGGGEIGGGGGIRPPVFKAIICGRPLEGQRTLEVEWLYDNWERISHKVWTFKATANGEDWAQTDYEGFADPYVTTAGSAGSLDRQPQRGNITQMSPEKKAWKLNLGPHSRDCQIHFNVPDPQGKIISTEVIEKIIVDGETSDHFMEAPSGKSIFPEWSNAWLSP